MSRPKQVARNILATVATQLVSWCLTFAVTLFLPRYIGDDGLGKLAFTGALSVVFGAVIPLGTSTVLIKEIARDRGKTGELITAAALLRAPLGLLMLAVATGMAHALHYPPVLRLMIEIFGVSMIVSSLNDTLSSALQGQENMPRQSRSILVDKFLSSILTIALVILRAPLWSIAAVGIVSGLCSLAVNLTAFESLKSTLRWPSWATMKFIVVAGMPYFGWTLFRTLYGQTDPVIIKFLTDDATVGWYAAAFRLFGSTMILPNAITMALLPTLARLHTADSEAFATMARRALGIVALCGIPVSFIFMVLPGQVIALMHYPAQFAHSIPVLQIGGLAVFLWYVAAVLGMMIVARDDQAKMLKVCVVACAISVPLCIAGTWLTSRFIHNGAIGAIASDVLTEVYLIGVYLKMLPKSIFDRSVYSLLMRLTIAASPMVLLFWLLGNLSHSAWILVPCLITYGIACWFLRCINIRDLRLFATAMKKEPAG